MENLTFNRVSLEALTKEYRKAVESNKDSFMFQGNELHTGYAKYLIAQVDFELHSEVSTVSAVKVMDVEVWYIKDNKVEMEMFSKYTHDNLPTVEYIKKIYPVVYTEYNSQTNIYRVSEISEGIKYSIDFDKIELAYAMYIKMALNRCPYPTYDSKEDAEKDLK